MAPWQNAAFCVLLAGLATIALSIPDAGLAALSILLAVPFLCVTALRGIALIGLLRHPAIASAQTTGQPEIRDGDLPVYSILVPLHDEAEMLAGLVKSLSNLDYPVSRLDILLVLEATDHATRRAAEKMLLLDHVRIIVVPPGGPQTKPKALNYALELVRGSYVVVYDAEDRPEPDQLRAALAKFQVAGPDLACVQARLNVYNPRASFLTRQFALEYSALFDAILPALERLGLPVPLGGTSNHFPVATLRQAGAWDPFNVTEDADLGIRLARLDLTTATIGSTTWEEAPEDLGNWGRQRTRWLKGWTQTYIVHMRQPGHLLRELGLLPFLGFQILMGAVLLSVLAHPLFYALGAWEAWCGRLFATPSGGLATWAWWIAAANLGLGALISIALGAGAAVRRGERRLALSALAMPVYWLLISAAGYRALWQLARQPYLWEKTQHGRRRG